MNARDHRSVKLKARRETRGDGEKGGENLLRNGIKITALSARRTDRLVIPV